MTTRPVQQMSRAQVTDVPIDRIVIGPRRREKLGGVQGLARSIATNGLIHPIVLRGLTLVAGQRRLAACGLLKWKTIPARQVEHLSHDELRAIELDENTQRLALTDYATSKARLAEIRQVEADLKAKAEVELSGESPRNRTSGRPRQSGSKRTVAKETNVSARERGRVEQHVELAERFPFMQRGGWVQHSVLEAGTVLDRLPERDRSGMAALLDQDGIPPRTAIGILENVVKMSSADRQDVLRLARSDDAHERVTALTQAAALPPPVDPGLTLLGDAEERLRRAAKACRTVAFQPKLHTLASDATDLLSAFQEANAHARRSIRVQPVNDASTDPRSLP